MTLSLSTPLISQGELTPDQFVAAVILKPNRTKYTDAEVRKIADRTVHWCAVFGFNHDIPFSQMPHETDWFRFTGDVRFGQHNFAGLGATGGVPGHSFPLPNGLIKDDGIEAGVLAVIAHHAVYRWGEKSKWPAHLQQYAGNHVDPRYSAVLSTGNAGKMIVLGDYRGTWAVPGTHYPEALIGRAEHIATFPKGEPMGLSETIMERIAAKGVEIHDIRGQLERHASKSPETRPNGAWRYTAVHHTAVSRGVRSLAGDIESWQGHARHHAIDNGWPAIAYFLGFSQSGRAFLLRDVHEVGYHAFAGANYQTLATCGDLHITNAPTPQLLSSYETGLRVLHEQTPELPNLIGHTGTYGHQELTFLDPQNSTACPGQLLPWTRDYREQVGPKNDPNARHFPETGHWIVNLPNAKMLDLWLELGGVKSEGYPLGGMVLDNDGVYRQLTENSLLEIWPDETGRRGGLGQRYQKLMDAAGQVQLAVSDEDGGV